MHQPARRLLLILASLGMLWAMPFFATVVLADEPPRSDGYTYTVRAGDTWYRIAVRTDRSEAELLAGNPEIAKRPNRTLIAGEQIQIPPREAAKGYWYQVRRGEYWALIAQRTGVPIRELLNYNPAHVRRGYILYTGEWIWIPRPAPTATAPCPDRLDAFGDAIQAQLNAGAEATTLRDWLIGCKAMTQERGMVKDLAFKGVAGLLIILSDPGRAGDARAESDLLIFHKEAAGWTQKFQARGISGLNLLETGDLNADGRPDVAYVATDCGAHSCDFSVGIVSWDGSAYRYWVDDLPRMFNAEVQLEEASAKGSGKELVMHGGVIQSAGAGPQRAWIEVWESPAGAPYTRTLKIYDASECLYHAILEANAAFLQGRAAGFATAIALYRLAIDNPLLQACGAEEPETEVNDLRAFARFRLALTYTYAGEPASATAVVEEAEEAQPEHPYIKAARAFLNAYQAANDVAAACAEVDKAVSANPSPFLLLGRAFGYANPPFGEKDVCPVLPQP
jgi:LysM repeat protein/tetratricopeptide (TPR) repeat protein